MTATTWGLVFGIALGFAGWFGGFGAFIVVLVLGLIGMALGRVVEGRFDFAELTDRARWRRER
jgi:chromate transport protein ChrA